jgi:large subunit ribosomal protein L18
MLFTQEKRIRRHARGRAKIEGSEKTPRLSVFKSSNHIYAQLINDQKGATIASASERDLKGKKIEAKDMSGKVAIAYEVGKAIALKAKGLKVEKIIFDKSGYDYHGRIKALAQGARDGGLVF